MAFSDQAQSKLAAGNGCGYKFAPVIGEILADLALAGETRHDVGFLSAQRFST